MLGADAFSWSVSSSEGGQSSTSVIQDVITDFAGAGAAGGDTLELVQPFGEPHRLTFRGALPTLPAIGSALAFGNNDFMDVFYAFDGVDTILVADSDDDGVFDAEDFSVRLLGSHTLVQSDFGDTGFVTAGTDGNDVINGTPDDDTIIGLGGRDTISGRDGNDVIEGGDGADVLNGNAGNDSLEGQRGNDELNGGAGRDFITGEEGNDTIHGGGDDNSVLSGGDGDDAVFGDDGDDTVDGDAGRDVLHGGAGEDVLFAGTGNDTLFGDAGDDELFGDDGADELFGGGGADELEGDAGADTLTGGGGNDELVFFASSFNPSSIFNAPDMVTDFEGAGVAGGDVIELSTSNPLVFRGEVFITGSILRRDEPKLRSAEPILGGSPQPRQGLETHTQMRQAAFRHRW